MIKVNNKSKKYYLLAGFTLVNLINAGVVKANDVTLESPQVASSTTPTVETNLSDDSALTDATVSDTMPEVNTNTATNSSQETNTSTAEQVITDPSPSAVAPKDFKAEAVALGQTQDTSATYASHVQNTGWQAPVSEGQVSGTTGQSKRVEAIKINIDSPLTGSVTYASHVQGIGWQTAVSEGQVSGTTGQSRAIEAIRITLTGDLALNYDIYYRTHIASFGWLGWAKNGQNAGSQGLSKRMEAYEIQLVKKGELVTFDTNRAFLMVTEPTLNYKTYVQGNGWQLPVSEGELSGTTGLSKRVEALIVQLGSTEYGNIEYRSHVQDSGWQNYVSSDKVSGTIGQSKRIEALQMRLTGMLADKFSVKYRVHVQDIGWQDWVYDNYMAGTVGKSKRIEAIEIQLVNKVAKPTGLSASQGNYAAINKVIYLDAGHGGYDPGASYFGQTEKSLNLSMQNLIKSKLERAGYTVVTTRTSDTYTDLVPRSAKANSSLSDLFVSLHFNASTSSYANGIETYYYEYYEEYPSAINDTFHNDAERLRRSSILASAIQSATVSNTGAKNNGVLRNTFAVLRETTAPAVLLELGYMSNAAEFQKINSSAYREKLAQGVVSGILSYYKKITV